MAVHVEDHPVEYFDFEGTIPAKQYGAGDVIVWDWGTWEPEHETPDPAAAIDEGRAQVPGLHGEKLKGRFTIVRTSRRPGSAPRTAFEDDEGEQWLLLHKRDDARRAGLGRRGLPAEREVGPHERRGQGERARDLGQSDAPAATAEIDLAGAPRGADAPLPRADEGDPRDEALPRRGLAVRGQVGRLPRRGRRPRRRRSACSRRNGNNAETYFPRLLTPPSWIDAREAIVDGEVVALDDDGRPDFSLLQERISAGRTGTPVPLVYQAFDLLYLDGRSLARRPARAAQEAPRARRCGRTSRVRYASHIDTEGVAFFEAAKAQQLEGIVAKQRRSRYEPGRRTPALAEDQGAARSRSWSSAAGRPGRGTRRSSARVVVGVYEGERLRFSGKVGSGFDGRTRKELRAALDALETELPPFDPPPAPDYRGRWGGDLAGVRWIRPGARDPRRDRRLDARRARPPDGVQGPRARPRPARGRARAGDRPGGRGTRGVRAAVAYPARAAGCGRAARCGDAIGRRCPRRRRAAASRRSPPPPAQSTPPWLVTPAELEALAALKGEGHLARRRPGPQAHEPRQGPVPAARAASDEQPGDEARARRATSRGSRRRCCPHLADRPLNLQRFPNGAGAPGFWQKDIPSTAPKWLTIWHETGFREREDRAANDHLIADRAATLCWLGNQAAFEVHAWTSTTDDPWLPTFALIDIDPGPKTTWDETLILARLYRTALEHLGVRAYPKTTGSRGIQAWIPIERGRYSYDETSAWVEKLSQGDRRDGPGPRVVGVGEGGARRQGAPRLHPERRDQDARRPVRGPSPQRAPRSRRPIRWEELDDPSLAPDRWTIRNVVERVAEVGDLYAGAQTDHQVLPDL